MLFVYNNTDVMEVNQKSPYLQKILKVAGDQSVMHFGHDPSVVVYVIRSGFSPGYHDR